MNSVCVFCGSSAGARPAYGAAARETGAEIARRGLTLVYGGGRVGLMGAVADAALAEGGEVVGVMPRALVEGEISHTGLTKLHVVGSMHERKMLMNDLSDGFVALPGGYGTLEEFFEVLSWAQLGIHAKPCALLDAEGFWGPLASLLDHTVAEGFVHPDYRSLVPVEGSPGRLLDAMARYEPPKTKKWVRPEEL